MGRPPYPRRASCALLAAGLLAAGGRPRPEPPPAAPGPERVVSLAPNLTEMICALDADAWLAGRTSACDYPPDRVARVPVVGGFGAPSLDALAAVRPTLVVDVALEDERIGRLLDRLGIRRARVPCATLDDIPAALLSLGRLLRREPQAERLAGAIRAGLAARRQALAARRAAGGPLPTVLVEIWGDPLMTVGRRSFVSELVELAGGRNLGDAGGGRDYFPVSTEWVLARDPDVILCFEMAGPNASPKGDADAARRRLAARLGWGSLKAVRAGRVYGALDPNLILRPGPRVLEGIAAVRACLDAPPPGVPRSARRRDMTEEDPRP